MFNTTTKTFKLKRAALCSAALFYQICYLIFAIPALLL